MGQISGGRPRGYPSGRLGQKLRPSTLSCCCLTSYSHIEQELVCFLCSASLQSKVCQFKVQGMPKSTFLLGASAPSCDPPICGVPTLSSMGFSVFFVFMIFRFFRKSSRFVLFAFLGIVSERNSPSLAQNSAICFSSEIVHSKQYAARCLN